MTNTDRAPSTPTWPAAHLDLRQQLGAWIDASIAEQCTEPFRGGHDEGSFTAAWDAYYFLTHDSSVLGFLTWLRDGFAEWADGDFYHGYWTEGEAHHGTEGFTHFAARFRTLDRSDPVAPRMLDDAAEHVGNWAEGIPDWYDWAERRFRSFYIGTKVVRPEPPDDFEEPDSIRLAMIAMAAYAATGNGRYLDFCLRYGDKWADALAEKPLPRVAFWPSGDDSYDEKARAQPEAALEVRLELVASSGMVDYLLDLAALSEPERYKRAFDAVIPTLVATVADHRNATSAGHLAKYRRVTGDRRYDGRIMAQLGEVPDDDGDLRILDVRDEHKKRRNELIFNEHIGRRADQIRWGRPDATGSIREISEPTPAAWALAYQITDSERFAVRAMDQAARRMELANAALDDGRNHGCSGHTAGSVASGHGRADRYGDVNTVLGPLALGSVRMFSAEQPLVVYPDGLPPEVATLVSMCPGPTVTWRNVGDEAVSFRWRDASDAGSIPQWLDLHPGETDDDVLAGPMPVIGIPTSG